MLRISWFLSSALSKLILITSADMIQKIKFPKADLNFSFTFDGGQAFRWKQAADGKWIGVFAHRVWKLWQDNDYIFYEVFKGEHTDDSDHAKLLENYFRLEKPLPQLYEEWAKNDSIFKEASKKFTGVRMLNQNPVEIIFTFICSSNNNISRIKSMVEKMCKFYGEEITEVDNVKYYDFPKLEKLANSNVLNELKEAAFGYRAKFIQQAACKILEFGGNKWIANLQKLPYKESKLELMKLPGVGAKVADCICLMSLNHLEAIPVDTHVFQIATKYYLPHLKNVKSVTDRVYNEIGEYFRNMYGQYAGWSHSVLFCDDLKAFKIENSSSLKRKRSPKKENKKQKK